MENQKIYSAICGVMSEIGAVGKNDKNRQQGYLYRGIDAVMNALNPAMIKHKVFCVPEILEQTREERTTKSGTNMIYSICKIKYRFYADDGSFVETITIGEGMDTADKSTNKAMAIAFKYACFQTFCIPTEDLIDDPDKQTPEPSTKKEDKTKKDTNPAEKNEDKEIPSFVFLKMIDSELIRTGVNEEKILSTYKVKKINEMTQEQYTDCIKRLNATPSKKEEDEED